MYNKTTVSIQYKKNGNVTNKCIQADFSETAQHFFFKVQQQRHRSTRAQQSQCSSSHRHSAASLRPGSPSRRLAFLGGFSTSSSSSSSSSPDSVSSGPDGGGCANGVTGLLPAASSFMPPGFTRGPFLTGLGGGSGTLVDCGVSSAGGWSSSPSSPGGGLCSGVCASP